MPKENDTYSPEEAARRRDEVIHRMVNTPPQPHGKTRHSEKKKAPVAKRAPRKKN